MAKEGLKKDKKDIKMSLYRLAMYILID